MWEHITFAMDFMTVLFLSAGTGAVGMPALSCSQGFQPALLVDSCFVFSSNDHQGYEE